MLDASCPVLQKLEQLLERLTAALGLRACLVLVLCILFSLCEFLRAGSFYLAKLSHYITGPVMPLSTWCVCWTMDVAFIVSRPLSVFRCAPCSQRDMVCSCFEGSE